MRGINFLIPQSNYSRSNLFAYNASTFWYTDDSFSSGGAFV